MNAVGALVPQGARASEMSVPGSDPLATDDRGSDSIQGQWQLTAQDPDGRDSGRDSRQRQQALQRSGHPSDEVN